MLNAPSYLFELLARSSDTHAYPTRHATRGLFTENTPYGTEGTVKQHKHMHRHMHTHTITYCRYVVVVEQGPEGTHTGTGCPCTGWPEGCTPVVLENKDIWSVVGLFQSHVIWKWTGNALFIIVQTDLGQCDKWSLNTQFSCLIVCSCFPINSYFSDEWVLEV